MKIRNFVVLVAKFNQSSKQIHNPTNKKVIKTKPYRQCALQNNVKKMLHLTENQFIDAFRTPKTTINAYMLGKYKQQILR
ncbi:hypothetical protein C2869_02800 [Saccharobesus litoralis]|uniref:Uncharacterized protein n=1 Tax=Saccharobesus litoralis TaxID=2172099 RepID=A0A2S0VMM2_9ALTE|nr:hypothetical protein C2869_02800 [Saccharobesus litoralis]